MPLADEEVSILRGIARSALEAAVRGREYSPPDPGRPGLAERRGCFVTLKTGGELRGCLGCFSSSEPLYRAVSLFAAYSALEDPRFTRNRLTPLELPAVDMEISILSELTPCRDPMAITPGVHGIQVSRGSRSGCFLPQVASETGWTPEEFWGHCSRDKAGLEWDAWKKHDAKLMTFTAEIVECPAWRQGSVGHTRKV